VAKGGEPERRRRIFRERVAPEIRVDCPDEIRLRIATMARDRFKKLGYDIVDVDGVRVKFGTGGA
jgi:phosphomannomutase/phosphoglucomutase